jgi:hypothetical protein
MKKNSSIKSHLFLLVVISNLQGTGTPAKIDEATLNKDSKEKYIYIEEILPDLIGSSFSLPEGHPQRSFSPDEFREVIAYFDYRVSWYNRGFKKTFRAKHGRPPVVSITTEDLINVYDKLLTQPSALKYINDQQRAAYKNSKSKYMKDLPSKRKAI